MINENGEYMVEHHVKYIEIHGVDETIWMTASEHKKLHQRLRQEGECNIPSDELNKISCNACMRTKKFEGYQKKHYEQRKETQTRLLVWIDNDIINYINEKIEEGTFANRAHYVKQAVKFFRENKDGLK